MRIATDLRSLMGGKISGVENYLLRILEHLPEAEAKNYFGFFNSFKSFSWPHLNPALEIKKTRIPNKLFNAALTLFKLPLFESLYGDFDVLWMPDLRPFALKKKTKLAITVHDLSPVMHPQFYSLKRRIWHKLINYKKSFSRADLIFAVSEYTKYDLIKIFKLNPEKIKVIYSGIDHARFNTELEQRLQHKVRVRHNLPEKFILSISTLEPRKNIAALIRAFELIEDPEMHLVIAGKLGWLYHNLLRQIQESSKKDQIHFIGYISEEDKPFVISMAAMVCYPSFYEGFGFVPLEAMACGVPVVTSARTSMPEICGDAALLVEPNSINDIVSALNSLNSDPELRRGFIAKGIAQAKKFQWQDTVRQINEQLTTLK